MGLPALEIKEPHLVISRWDGLSFYVQNDLCYHISTKVLLGRYDKESQLPTASSKPETPADGDTPPAVVKFLCDVCSREFKTKRAMYVHKYRAHPVKK